MESIYGKHLDKKELLKRVGNMSQLAFIKPFKYTEGRAAGVKAFNVSNGTGLDFTVLESKCLDIVSMRYKGMNLNYLPKSGIVAPDLVDMNGTEFMRSISGGMMYTCGLLNVGAACVDEGLSQVFHGRMKTTPAEKVGISCDWEEDDYVLKLKGEMREAAIFNDNLVMKRMITTKCGVNSVKIHDEIENQGFEEQSLMLLYHINIGYPVLDEEAKLVIPSLETKAKDATAQAEISEYGRMTGPVDGFTEQVFVHKVACDGIGKTGTAIINNRLGLGVYIQYNAHQLPNLVEWKSMRSGDYAFGISPSTCCASGRVFEKEHGSLKKIAPLEKINFDVEIGVLDGENDIKQFEKFIKSLL